MKGVGLGLRGLVSYEVEYFQGLPIGKTKQFMVRPSKGRVRDGSIAMIPYEEKKSKIFKSLYQALMKHKKN